MFGGAIFNCGFSINITIWVGEVGQGISQKGRRMNKHMMMLPVSEHWLIFYRFWSCFRFLTQFIHIHQCPMDTVHRAISARFFRTLLLLSWLNRQNTFNADSLFPELVKCIKKLIAAKLSLFYSELFAEKMLFTFLWVWIGYYLKYYYFHWLQNRLILFSR